MVLDLPCRELALGPHRYDIRHRALVMGILNRTPDSFFDQGTYFDFDAFLAKADQLVAEGADLLDVGGVKAGPGPEVGEAEELERVIPALEALRARFDVPLSVDTWRASVLRAAIDAGAVVGNDISGFADPDYLSVAAAGGASVVATHIRIGPRVPDPEPVYDEPVVDAVCRFLEERGRRAEAAGIPRERVMVDAGLDLGKTEPQSLELLRAHGQIAALGWPVFLSASNKRFLGHVVGTDVDDRREASHAAHALGVALGLPRAAGPRRAGRPADGGRARRGARSAGRPRGAGGGMTAAPPITLLKGDDEVVLRDAVRLLVDELVGDDDRSLVVEDVEVGATDEDGRDPLLALVDAAQTPPFLTEHRVVVGRLAEKRERNDQVAALVEYLADPLPTTRLVLEWRTGKIPKALVEAIDAAGGQQVDTSPGRKVADWVQQHLADTGLKVDADGRRRLVTWVGDEPSRLLGLIDLLRSTYGDAKLGVDDLEPFLGDDGGVPPWELTDAIDRGDRALALELLHRMLGQGERHPFQILATLHSHVARILRLDGAEVTTDKQAAEVLGVRGSTFPAKKALGQARKLGHDRIVRMLDLLAEADLDLRGGKAWPDNLVLEVLVARLATMSR